MCLVSVLICCNNNRLGYFRIERTRKFNEVFLVRPWLYRRLGSSQ